MRSISVFLDIIKVADFWWNNVDISRNHGVCHVIFKFFGTSLVRHNCPKFLHCAVCETDYGKGGCFVPHPWAAPKNSILNRVNLIFPRDWVWINLLIKNLNEHDSRCSGKWQKINKNNYSSFRLKNRLS